MNDLPISDPEKRKEYLMSKIDLSNLNDDQISRVANICMEFSDAFFIPNDVLKPTPIYKHSIKLKPNVDVVFVKQYRVPFAQRDEMKRQVDNWEKLKIIQKSTSSSSDTIWLM